MNLLPLILPPAFGFVIGFVTNAVAIRMMFRPYQEVRFLGLRFQGMIPRRKADIARNISHTVVSELLREESVADRIAGTDVRNAVEELLLQLAERYLGREYGPLERILGRPRSAVVERALTHVLLEAGRSGQEWVETPEGLRVLRSVLENLLDRSVGDFLRGEESLVSQIVVDKALATLSAPDIEARVRQALARLLVRVASADRPLRALVPEEAVEAVLRAVRSAVPDLLRRFEQALLSPQNVVKIKGAIRAGIEAYLRETKGGLVKNLARQAALFGRERIFQEADGIVDANLYRLGELVYEEENRAHVDAAIEESLNAFLKRTPSDLLGSLPPETLDLLYDRAAAWVCRHLRRPESTAALARLLEDEVERLFRMPLREVAEVSGIDAGAAERWARSLARWAAEGGLESLARREGPLLARAVMTTPVGRPDRFLPEALARDIAALALDQMMPVVSSKVPEILRIVDVQALIEREILEFSPREIERLILSVARRELRAITWWGGVLGTVVGGVQTVMALVGG